MLIKQVITAQNCVIEIPDGHEVGYLQNLTINASYNLQPIKNLYQHTIQQYAQGIAQYAVTAQRGFIEMDSIFGDQRALVQFLDSLENLTNKNQENTTANNQMLQWLDDIGTIIRTGKQIWDKITSDNSEGIIDTLKEIFLGNRNIGDLFTLIKFNIRVANPIVQYPETLGQEAARIAELFTGNRSDLYILKDCKVNSRNMVINPENVLVMETVEIFAEQMEDAVFRANLPNDLNIGNFTT